MSADDTSRDALIERVARVLDVEGAFCGECGNEPGDFYDECSQCRRLLTRCATAVVSLLRQRHHRGVNELKAENERLRDTARNYKIAMHGARGERDSEQAEVERLWANLDESREYTKKALAERDAAIKRAEAAEAERDTWHERWRQLMRDYEALFREREAAEAALEAVRDAIHAAPEGSES